MVARKLAGMAGFCLLLFGGRLLLVEYAGSDVPYWDQWDAEAYHLIAPFLAGELALTDLFTAHNEHRIFFTRVLALGLFWVNGQWDPYLELVVNAGLATLCFFMLWLILREVGLRKLDAWLAVLIGGGALVPFAWQNSLHGFQSQFFFMLLFAELSIYGCLACDVLTRRWWLGVFCLFASLFSMASGLMAGVTVLILSLAIALWSFYLSRSTQGWLWTSLPAALAVGLGVFSIAFVSNHAQLRAESAAQFLTAFANAAGWPWASGGLPALFMQVPVILLFGAILMSRRMPRRDERLVLGLAAWVVLQSASIAFARAGADTTPAPRYMDLLMVGPVVNFCALYLLAQFETVRRWPGAFVAAASVWLLALVVGGGWLAVESTWQEVQRSRAISETQSENLRNYLLESNPAHLENKERLEIPYPSASRLMSILSNEALRDVLPSGVRKPVSIVANINNGFGEHPSVLPAPHGKSVSSYSNADGQSKGRYESTWFDVTAAYLAIDLAGRAGGDGMSVALESDNGTVRPIGYAYPIVSWYTWYERPRGDRVRIVAADDSASAWVSVANVRPVGFFSYAAKVLVARNEFFIGIGLLLLMPLLVWPPIERLFR